MDIKSHSFTDVSHYTIIKISGNAAENFLQGQLTCQIKEVTSTRYRLTAYCNAQGRMLGIARIWQSQEGYRLFMPIAVAEHMAQDLKKYAQFSKVSVEIVKDKSLFISSTDLSTILGKPVPTGAWEYSQHEDFTVIHISSQHYLVIGSDHRIDELKQVLINQHYSELAPTSWDLHEIQLGIPTIWKETIEKLLPHEVNLPELQGVSFDKGCYKGQEIISRMQYRAQRKKHMYQAHYQGSESPIPGHEVIDESEKKVGEVVSAAPNATGEIAVLVVLSNTAVDEQKPLFIKGAKIVDIKLPI